MKTTLAATTDLIFGGKINAECRAIGVTAVSVRSLEQLSATLDAGAVGLVLVDMAMGLEAASALIRQSAGHASGPMVVAFYSHVQADQRVAAEAAGARLVMARSKFVQELSILIRRHCVDEGRGVDETLRR